MRPAPLWTMLCSLLALQAFLLYYSLNYGLLVGPIQWDDTAFIERALMNLHRIASSESAYDLLRYIKNMEIHAPVGDLQTTFGLLFGGGNTWLPFALGVLTILPPFYVTCRSAARFGYVTFLALLVFLLIQPMTFNALLYLKSDWKGAVYIGAALLALYEGAEDRDNRLTLIGAGLLALCTLTKLTAFYVPFLAIVILMLFELYWAVANDKGTYMQPSPNGSLLAARLRKWASMRGKLFLLCALVAVLPYGFFFVLNADDQMAYILDALGGRWVDGFTRAERLFFYSPFSEDGSAIWGSVHWAFLISVAGAMVVAVRQRHYRYMVALAAVLIMAGLFAAPLILAKSSNPSFAATLVGIFVGGTLISTIYLARSLPPWSGWPILVIFAALAVPLKLPLSNSTYISDVGKMTNAELRELDAIYRDLADMLNTPTARLAEISSSRDPRIVVFFQHMYAPERNLTYLRFRQQHDIVRVRRIDSIEDPDGVTEDLANAEFALTIRADGPERTFVYIPGGGDKDPVSLTPNADRFVDQNPDYTLVGTWRLSTGDLRLYRNTAGL